VKVEQHRFGVGEDNWAPEPALNDRAQKSYAFKANNSHFTRDQKTDRYNYGVTRPATATGASVEDDPSYVPVTDDETGAAFNVYMQTFQPFVTDDRVMYVLVKDGTAWTFGGGCSGSSGLRKATATGNWSGNNVAATDDVTGEVLSIYLPATMPGDPNVRSGAPIYYMTANDGEKVCLTDYMDDKIGTLKAFNADGNNPVPGWFHHSDSAGKVVPNYLAGDPDYPTTGATGGNKQHDHDEHIIPLTGVEVVTAASFDDETCELSTTLTQICFIGSVV
jgi:hypothetical protein